MTVDFSYKKIWSITYPILLSLLMEQMVGLTDTAFMGRVGEVELGAAAIAGVFYLIAFMIGYGFCIGAQIMMARRNGASQFESIGSIFSQGMYFLMALALVLWLVCRFFAGDILSLLISSPHVLAKAEAYVHWRIYGFFFAFAGGMFNAYYVATTRTMALSLNSVVLVLSNFVFNYILVFGKLGFPALGIEGAAIGSSLAELVSLLFLIAYTRLRVDYGRYGLNRIPAVDFGVLKSVLGLSAWVMVQNFLMVSTWFIYFVMIEHLGEEPLAITNIVRGLGGFLFMVVMAFSSCCSSVVSNMMGAGQAAQVTSAIGRHIKLAYACVLPLALLFAVFPTTFTAIYTDIPRLITASVPSLWVMCSSYAVQVPSNVLFQSVSGTGSTRMAFFIELTTLVFYVTYIVLLVFYLRVDVAIAWTSEIVYGTVMLVLCLLFIRRGGWRRAKV